MLKVHFLVSVYGTKRAGMLLTLLFSIRQSNPLAKTTVLWQNMPEDIIITLRRAFDSVRFCSAAFSLRCEQDQRIAGKTRFWQAAVETCGHENVVLLDVDTLVIRNLEDLFADSGNWDIGLTHQPDLPYPLNSGVMLLRANKASREFLAEWTSKTSGILSDQQRMREANSCANPYGGADQMALHLMLGYQRSHHAYSLELPGTAARIHMFPCALINEIRSVPISEKTRVIHYKGGWHSVLIDGGNFSKKRSRKASEEMYHRYLTTFEASLRWLESKGDVPRELQRGIAIPFYFGRGVEPRPILYPAYFAWAFARAFTRRAIERVRRMQARSHTSN